MPLRALRLLAFPTISEPIVASSLSFASTLELAAGQAWTRRVIAHTQIRTTRKRGLRTSAVLTTCNVKTEASESHGSSSSPSPSNLHKHHPNPVAGTDTSRHSFARSSKLHTKARQPLFGWCERLQREPHSFDSLPLAKGHVGTLRNVIEISSFEKGSQTNGVCEPNRRNIINAPSPSCGLPPGNLMEPKPPDNACYSQDQPLSLPPPLNPSSLYRNLLFLINDRKPSTPLPSLLDYHGRYPQFQSARSYNLLLDLSLRHRIYGTSYLLFRSIDRYGIPRNIETHRLMIQFLIQQGLWNDAWVYLDSLRKRGLLPKDEHGRQSIPFPIWITFFRISTRSPKYSTNNDQAKPELDEALKTIQAQYHFLTGLRPAQMPPLSHTHPFAIFCVIDLILKVGEKATATALAKAYLTALPRPISPNLIFGCLKIIHTLVSRKVKPGLPGYYKARKTLFTFLKLHPSLRPNSKTVLLLFNMLSKAKRCGTVAWSELIRFSDEFGPQLASRRVLRRVSHLALKEGRLDIVKLAQEKGRVTRRFSPRKRSIITRSRLSHREIYPGCGRDAQSWLRHKRTVRRKLSRLAQDQFGDH
ncbi:hypothetical protein CPB83DRAFT_841653 [Crepidotus variabilis]|uniref:Uncharacterized protein n=1 Tax=Crepidotus variabilis TaxID=179855 RepID=A0A9P6JWP9_9AGAR|nr:hypothetical protein CPB83DRAFT_841653 [Crepidotus variabilis]